MAYFWGGLFSKSRKELRELKAEQQPPRIINYSWQTNKLSLYKSPLGCNQTSHIYIVIKHLIIFPKHNKPTRGSHYLLGSLAGQRTMRLCSKCAVPNVPVTKCALHWQLELEAQAPLISPSAWFPQELPRYAWQLGTLTAARHPNWKSPPLHSPWGPLNLSATAGFDHKFLVATQVCSNLAPQLDPDTHNYEFCGHYQACSNSTEPQQGRDICNCRASGCLQTHSTKAL